MTHRPLRTIATEIRRDWKNPSSGAVPYLAAMSCLTNIEDDYGAETAKSAVIYFLSNATDWHGETARRIKDELNSMAKEVT